DGRSLLYFVVGLDGQASIRQLDLATGFETAVVDSPLSKNSPVWLPDGRSIAYAENGPNGWQVWRHDLVTGLRSSLGLSGYPLVRLAYDGSGLLLGDLVTSRIDQYGFASRKLTTLYSGRFDRDPYLWVASPQGLLFVTRTTASDGELRLTAAGGRESVVANLPGLNFYSAPALSPDGRRFITAQRTLSEVDLALVSASPSEPAVAMAKGGRK
ncbi:MAG: PD40 domain-containing protein, partial [Alphaproteobacteria bacterium]|nr:PD40 domain-containing protein [Alphaproteobacteria bacterium]